MNDEIIDLILKTFGEKFSEDTRLSDEKKALHKKIFNEIYEDDDSHKWLNGKTASDLMIEYYSSAILNKNPFLENLYKTTHFKTIDSKLISTKSIFAQESNLVILDSYVMRFLWLFNKAFFYGAMYQSKNENITLFSKLLVFYTYINLTEGIFDLSTDGFNLPQHKDKTGITLLTNSTLSQEIFLIGHELGHLIQKDETLLSNFNLLSDVFFNKIDFNKSDIDNLDAFKEELTSDEIGFEIMLNYFDSVSNSLEYEVVTVPIYTLMEYFKQLELVRTANCTKEYQMWHIRCLLIVEKILQFDKWGDGLTFINRVSDHLDERLVGGTSEAFKHLNQIGFYNVIRNLENDGKITSDEPESNERTNENKGLIRAESINYSTINEMVLNIGQEIKPKIITEIINNIQNKESSLSLSSQEIKNEDQIILTSAFSNYYFVDYSYSSILFNQPQDIRNALEQYFILVIDDYKNYIKNAKLLANNKFTLVRNKYIYNIFFVFAQLFNETRLAQREEDITTKVELLLSASQRCDIISAILAKYREDNRTILDMDFPKSLIAPSKHTIEEDIGTEIAMLMFNYLTAMEMAEILLNTNLQLASDILTKGREKLGSNDLFDILTMDLTNIEKSSLKPIIIDALSLFILYPSEQETDEEMMREHLLSIMLPLVVFAKIECDITSKPDHMGFMEPPNIVRQYSMMFTIFENLYGDRTIYHKTMKELNFFMNYIAEEDNCGFGGHQ